MATPLPGGDVRALIAPEVDDDDARARAAWSAIAEPGDSTAGELIAHCGAAVALEVALSGTARETFDISPAALAAARRRWMPRASTIGNQLESAQRAGARLVVPGDPAWPTSLDDLGPHAPFCLWVRGDVGAVTAAGVALVGARAASAYGHYVVSELATELASSGVSIVSGGAYGIDGAAHEAALRVHGTTVALMAGGVDRTYPAGHIDLLEQVARAGAIVAESPCGASPTKWRFLSRNRLIAALSDATVVVEAGWRSGSINTAHHAATLGRPLGAVPGPVTSPTSAGCHRLLRDADAVCITSADDVRELMGATVNHPQTLDYAASPESVRVLDALSTRTPRSIDDIARRSGLSPGDVSSTLGLLELSERVVRDAAGWRMRSSR